MFVRISCHKLENIQEMDVIKATLTVWSFIGFGNDLLVVFV